MADRFAAARAACEDRLQRWRHGTWPQRRLSGGNSVDRVRPNEKRLVNARLMESNGTQKDFFGAICIRPLKP